MCMVQFIEINKVKQVTLLKQKMDQTMKHPLLGLTRVGGKGIPLGSDFSSYDFLSLRAQNYGF